MLCVLQPVADTGQLPDEERKKFEKEFDAYREKLDRAKEEYVTPNFCQMFHC